MEITKVAGGVCGALLILLLLKWGSEIIYHGSHDKTDLAYYLEIETNEVEEVEVEQIAFSELLAMADVSKGKKTFGKCKACHKLEPGAKTIPHKHTGYEEFFVLEGELIDSDGTIFKTGDFVTFLPGSIHGSHTETGCLLITFMRGMNEPLQRA